MQNDVLRAVDDGKCVFLVLLDLSAAFDTVSHSIILKRLPSKFGVEGSALKWINSYLTDRRQSVLVNGVYSEPTTLKYGVPQGSVLGPTIFSDYSSPAAALVRSHNISVQCYADDTQLYVAFHPNEEAEILERLEHCIEDLRKWMNRNRLKLNDSKTEFIVFGTKSKLRSITTTSVRVGKENIKTVKVVRNIGAYFDCEMKMNTQVNNMCKSAWRNLYSISKIRNYLTQDQAKTVIHAYVTTKLDANNSLLAGITLEQKQQLERLQNAAARVITGSKKFDHVKPLLHKLHWLPIEDRITFKILLLTYKSLNEKGPVYLRELFQLRDPPRTLRSVHALILDYPRTKLASYGDRAFSIAAAVKWNRLPQKIRASVSVNAFKCQLKSYLFRKRYTCV